MHTPETGQFFVIRWLRSHLKNSLYQNTYLIISIRIFGMGFGFLFWALVARLASPEDVGIATGTISAVTLLAGLAQLGLGYGLVQYLPSSTNVNKLINASICLSAGVGAVLSLIFLIGVPYWSPALQYLQANLLINMFFILFVISTTLSQLLHYLFLAKQELTYSLIKNAGQAFIAIVLLIMLQPISAGYMSAIGAYMLATISSLGIAQFWFLPRIQIGYRFSPSINYVPLRPFVGFSLTNHVTDQLQRLPDTVLPLLVISQLGTNAGAYFFIVWALGRAIAAWSGSVGESLFAEASNNPGEITNNSWKSVYLGLLLAGGMATAISLAGKYILAIYGMSYVENGLPLLYFVAFAAVPGVLLSICINILRVQNQLRAMSIIMLSSSGLGLSLSYLSMQLYGLTGAGIGWLISQLIVLIVTLIWWRLRKHHTANPILQNMPSIS